MFEKIAEKFNPNEWFRVIAKVIYKILRFPLDKWNQLPLWVRYAIYSLIFLFSVWFAYVTWKNRELWRTRV